MSFITDRASGGLALPIKEEEMESGCLSDPILGSREWAEKFVENLVGLGIKREVAWMMHTYAYPHRPDDLQFPTPPSRSAKVPIG